MESDSILPQLLLQLVLIAVNALFAATEIAVISLNETKVRRMAEGGDRKAAKMLRMVIGNHNNPCFDLLYAGARRSCSKTYRNETPGGHCTRCKRTDDRNDNGAPPCNLAADRFN